jgi:hypothetical protein
MAIQEIRYCLLDPQPRRFTFYCSGPGPEDALKKLSRHLALNPGNYRSIVAGFVVSPEQLPQQVKSKDLDKGYAIEAIS